MLSCCNDSALYMVLPLLNNCILRSCNSNISSQIQFYICGIPVQYSSMITATSKIKYELRNLELYVFWAAFPSSFSRLHLTYAHIFAPGDWLFPNLSCSLMFFYTCWVTSWNILLHYVHLVSSHSSFMTQFKHLLSGHPSLTPSHQAEWSLPLLLSHASSSDI